MKTPLGWLVTFYHGPMYATAHYVDDAPTPEAAEHLARAAHLRLGTPVLHALTADVRREALRPVMGGAL